METETFTSPLSFYSIETNYGDDALLVQPEEAYADLGTQTHDASPFPYFEDALPTPSELHLHDSSYMI